MPHKCSLDRLNLEETFLKFFLAFYKNIFTGRGVGREGENQVGLWGTNAATVGAGTLTCPRWAYPKSSWAKKKVCVTGVERARREQWKMSAETQETPACRAGQPEGAPWRYLTWSHWGTFSESKSEVAQSCPTLCDPMDYSPPGSSIHGIFHARVLEWVAISFSRESSWLREWALVSHVAGKHFTVWATREVSSVEEHQGGTGLPAVLLRMLCW